MIAPRIALNKKLNFPQKFAQNHKVSAKSLPKMEVSQYAGWRGLSIPTAAHVDGMVVQQGDAVAEFLQVLILWLKNGKW